MNGNEKLAYARLGIQLHSTAIRYSIWTSRDEKTALKRICEYISIRHRKIDPGELGEMADEYEEECKEPDNINMLEFMDLMIDYIGFHDPSAPQT